MHKKSPNECVMSCSYLVCKKLFHIVFTMFVDFKNRERDHITTIFLRRKEYQMCLKSINNGQTLNAKRINVHNATPVHDLFMSRFTLFTVSSFHLKYYTFHLSLERKFSVIPTNFTFATCIYSNFLIFKFPVF